MQRPSTKTVYHAMLRECNMARDDLSHERYRILCNAEGWSTERFADEVIRIAAMAHRMRWLEEARREWNNLELYIAKQQRG